MKTSSPTTPKPREGKIILLIGPPGSGKTTLMLQFPKLKIYDCDRNLDGPERFLRLKDKNLSYGYEPVCWIDEKTPRPVEKCYDFLMDELLKDFAAADTNIDTFAVDSLSMVNEFIARKIMKEQNVEVLALNHWTPFKTRLLGLLARLRNLGKTVLVSVHEHYLMEADPKNILIPRIIAMEPSINTELRKSLGFAFTDVWRCTVDQAPSGPEFKLTTVRTKLSELKNSLGLPNEIKNPTYEILKPYLTK